MLLRKALIEGYGSDFPEIDFKSPDFAMLRQLEQNVYSFSAAKNYQELKQATLLLKDGDRVRTFNEFKTEMLKLHNTFNKANLQTEYGTAVNGSELAARWTQFQANKEALPFLIYQTVGDSRVRASHKALDGIKRPIDDDFWKTYYPPNDWNCRCSVNQTGSGSATPDKKVPGIDIPKMFRTNLAEAGLIFPKGHPYYEGITQKEIFRSLGWLPKKALVRRLFESASGGYVDAHLLHNTAELEKNFMTSRVLAMAGHKVELLPKIDDIKLRGIMPKGTYENMNPDALVDGKIFEFQKHKANKTAIHNNIREAYKQADRIILHLDGNLSEHDIKRFCKGQLNISKISPDQLKEIWVIVEKHIYKYGYEDIINYK